jgi:putative RNA 2'-phosphotransferase
MDKSLVSISKYLSLILRHRPELIGVSLDPEGWLNIDTLIEAANRHGKRLSLELVHRVVAENDKQRFALSEDGLQIRASQGHSIPTVDLDLAQVEPPDQLYHGTVAAFLKSIRNQGLLKRSRNHVHLSADADTARRVGMRRGKPIVLIVDALSMHRDQFVFYLSQNGVWLTDCVPARYLRFPNQEASGCRR